MADWREKLVRRADGGQEQPEPPAGLPNYVVDPLKRQSAERLHKIASFAEELATYFESAEIESDGGESIVSKHTSSKGYTVVEKLQKCGDDSCSCMDPGREADLHGPYIWKVDYLADGKQDWTYYGKVFRGDDGDERGDGDDG